MTERVNQRICNKFCFKLEHSSAETIPLIKKAFGDDSMSEAEIKLWYKLFKDGRESVESDRRSGRPSTSRTPENVESFRAAINENRRLTVRKLEEDLGIPRTIVSRILTEYLGKKHVAAKFVPRLVMRAEEILCCSCTGLNFLVKHHITQVCHPLQPRFRSLRLLAFIKTEIAIEREELTDRKLD
jgi:hypothetical protein